MIFRGKQKKQKLMTDEQAKKAESELERLEYSEEQSCFHTDDILEVMNFPDDTTYRLLGIYSMKTNIEFTDIIWKLAGKNKIYLTFTEMEFMLGVYFIDKSKMEHAFYEFNMKKSEKYYN